MDNDIRALLAAKADALVRRDSAALSSMIDSSFVYVNASGIVLDKAKYIDVY
jgi:hypothetical protein